MTTKHVRYCGLMMTELIVSLTVLGMLMIAFAISLNGFRRLNYYQFTRQRCVSAAQATLDSVAVTGKAINEADTNRLWPGVIIRIDESEGTGQWKGLKLISVTAGGAALNKKVEVCLSRYFSKGDIAISKAGDIPALQER
jgi:type II secretory pathway pseudopilin PulG